MSSKKNQPPTSSPPASPEGEAGQERPDAETSAKATDTPSTEPLPETSTEGMLAEANVLRERLLRLQADFDNYRKRQAREFLESRSTVHKEIVEELLIPLDHLDHALASMGQSLGEDDSNVHGIKIIQTELRNVLERFGLQRMETLGKAFDPMQHEALGTLPATRDAPEGHIGAEVRAGYALYGKTLRAAQVMVAHGE